MPTLGTNSSKQTSLMPPCAHVIIFFNAMNRLISYEEAAGFLKNPPLLAPQPNFAKIQALRIHMSQALKQLDCLQSLIHGWLGLAMDPQMYALL
jgi:hypothetical protein